MKKILPFAVLFALFLSLIAPHAVSAHEVYVLDQNSINADLHAPVMDFMDTINDHLAQFLLWGVIVVAIILGVFFFSISRPIERLLDPVLMKIKRYAPHIAQITLGLSLLASGYYHALFGTELPFSQLFGPAAFFLSPALVILGALITLGILPRIASLAALVVFAVATVHVGWYMLSYLTYLGEALVLVLFGGAFAFFESKKVKKYFARSIGPKLHEYKFLLMRICFGISLVYASLYAKFIHGALALDVVTKYHLTNYFHFDPVFLVLGAMLVEVLLGLFFALGFEVRFTALFFLTFLTMSLVFFGESVWPHIVLIGTAVAMFVHGYDKYTLTVMMGKKMGRKKGMEPTL